MTDAAVLLAAMEYAESVADELEVRIFERGTSHVSVTPIGDEIVHLVKVMDPHNRFRFGPSVEMLAEVLHPGAFAFGHPGVERFFTA